MRATLWLGVASAVGCVPMEPSGRPLEPVSVSAPAPVAAPPAPATPAGGFDFESEDRDEATGTALTDPVDLQAKLLGLEVPERPAPQPSPAPTPPPEAVPVAPAAPPVPVWDPSKPLPDASFGVRVLATLLDIQPPRAILGLPDGGEQVVQPGAMLPDQGLVVLAIGRDAVQIATVTPQGFYAAVRTETVRALYPNTDAQ